MRAIPLLAFTCCCADIAAAQSPAVTVIHPGETLKSNMPAGDPERTAVVVTLQVTSEQTLTIEARSLDFDTTLTIRDGSKTGGETVIATDDDSGPGTNSVLTVDAKPGAVCLIQVSPSGSDWGGAFELTVQVGSHLPDRSDVGRRADFEYWRLVANAGKSASRPLVVARARAGLGLMSYEDRAYGDALASLAEALETFEMALDSTHPVVLDCVVARALVLEESGAEQESQALLDRTLANVIREKGQEHLSVAMLSSLKAASLARSGGNAAAVALYRKTLAIREKQLGPDHPLVAESLHLLAHAEEASGSGKDAPAQYERALVIFERQRGLDHPDVMRLLMDLGRLASASGSTESALAYDRRALLIAAKRLAPDDVVFGQLRVNLAMAYVAQKDLPSAKRLLREILDDQAKRDKPDVDIVDRAFSIWASALDFRTQIGEVAELIEMGAGVPQLAESLGLLQLFCAEPKDFQKALRGALELHQGRLGPRHPLVATDLGLVAESIAADGAYAEALVFSERAHAILIGSESVDPFQLACHLTSSARLLHAMGSFEEARRRFEQSLQIREQLHQGDTLPTALSLWRLGQLESDLGEYADARRHLERAHAIYARVQPNDVLAVEIALAMARVSLADGDPAAARKTFDEVLAFIAGIIDRISEVNKGTKSAVARGVVAKQVGLAASAVACVRTVLRGDEASVESRAALGPAVEALNERLGRYSGLADGLLVLAELFRDLNRPNEASVVYERALLDRVRRYGSNHPSVLALREGWAASLWDLRLEQESLKEARRSGEDLDSWLIDLIGTLPEPQALRLLGTRVKPEIVLFSGLVTAKQQRGAWLEACWEWSLRHRALVLEELAARNRRAPSGESPETREAKRQWTEARRRLSALWVRGPGTSPRESVRASVARRCPVTRRGRYGARQGQRCIPGTSELESGRPS